MIEGDGAVALGKWRHLNLKHVGRQGFVAEKRGQLLIDTFHLTLQGTKNVIFTFLVFILAIITLYKMNYEFQQRKGLDSMAILIFEG